MYAFPKIFYKRYCQISRQGVEQIPKEIIEYVTIAQIIRIKLYPTLIKVSSNFLVFIVFKFLSYIVNITNL